jgi:type IV pilus assembly protein PilV
MLLEALIAILIFSFGILGLVGLQANAINLSTDAKYRADAALLAN